MISMEGDCDFVYLGEVFRKRSNRIVVGFRLFWLIMVEVKN